MRRTRYIEYMRGLRLCCRVALGIAGGFALSGGCVKDNNDLTITIVPTAPIVFDAPFSIVDPNDSASTITLTPPWYGLRIKLKNNSSKTITLPAITLATFQGTKSASCVIGLSSGVLIELGPGLERFVGDTYDDAGNDIAVRTWYCDSLPTDTSTSGSSGSSTSTTVSYKYAVQLKAVGWYGTAAVPESRFEKKQSFSTE